jgi:hypothetical protein
MRGGSLRVAEAGTASGAMRRTLRLLSSGFKRQSRRYDQLRPENRKGPPSRDCDAALG